MVRALERGYGSPPLKSFFSWRHPVSFYALSCAKIMSYRRSSGFWRPRAYISTWTYKCCHRIKKKAENNANPFFTTQIPSNSVLMSSDSGVSYAPKDVGLPPLGYIVPPVILSNASRQDVYSFLIAYYEAYFHKGFTGVLHSEPSSSKLYAMAACPHEEVMALGQRNRENRESSMATSVSSTIETSSGEPVMANKKKRRCTTSSSSSKG